MFEFCSSSCGISGLVQCLAASVFGLGVWIGRVLGRLGRQMLGLSASETHRSSVPLSWSRFRASALCIKQSPCEGLSSLLRPFHE